MCHYVEDLGRLGRKDEERHGKGQTIVTSRSVLDWFDIAGALVCAFVFVRQFIRLPRLGTLMRSIREIVRAEGSDFHGVRTSVSDLAFWSCYF